MPAGERSQTWFPELVAELRESWRAGLAWQAIIDLRGELQRSLDGILSSRGIKPATVRCSYCGHVGPGRLHRSPCPLCFWLFGGLGSSRRIPFGSLRSRGRGIAHCTIWMFTASPTRARLSTDTARSRRERRIRGAGEQRSGADKRREFLYCLGARCSTPVVEAVEESRQ